MQPLLLPDIIMPDHRPQWSLAIPNLRLMTCGRWALSMRLRGSLLTPEETARTASQDPVEATVWLWIMVCVGCFLRYDLGRSPGACQASEA